MELLIKTESSYEDYPEYKFNDDLVIHNVFLIKNIKIGKPLCDITLLVMKGDEIGRIITIQFYSYFWKELKQKRKIVKVHYKYELITI